MRKGVVPLDEKKLQAMEKLYMANYDELMRAAERMLWLEKVYAEDMVQQTFMAAWLHLDKVLEHENPTGWLMDTLKYVIQNYMGKKRKRITLSLDELFSGEEINLPDHTAKVELECEAIPLNMQKMEEFILLKRIYVDGVSQEELAKELGISYASCRQRVVRAKKKLAKELAEAERKAGNRNGRKE